MKKRSVGLWTVCFLCLGLQVQAPGGDSAGLPGEGSRRQRLIYVFSAGREAHLVRARQLAEWAAGTSGDMELVGLVRGVVQPASADDVAGALQRRLGFPVRTRAQCAGLGFPGGWLDGLPADMDGGVLLNRDGDVAWALSGEQLRLRLLPDGAATDIDASTWGKIKEMFQ